MLTQTSRGHVVITGGAGFIGSHLCERFLREDYDVTAIDSFLTGIRSNLGHLEGYPRFRLVPGDVTCPIEIAGPVNLVLHFASPASPIDYLANPIHTMKVVSFGAFYTLGLARERGARYVLASTSEVYGDPLEHPQGEEYWGNVNPVGPRSVYDEAKRFGEAVTMAYHRVHAVDTGSRASPTPTGPGCGATTGERFLRLSTPPLPVEPSRSMGMGCKPGAFATSTTLLRGCFVLRRIPILVGTSSTLVTMPSARFSISPRWSDGSQVRLHPSPSGRSLKTILESAARIWRRPGDCWVTSRGSLSRRPSTYDCLVYPTPPQTATADERVMHPVRIWKDVRGPTPS